MELRSQSELNNTREKLRRLEEHYARLLNEPAENQHVRDLSRQSMKRWINKLKEEIARYEARRGARSADRPS
jgi:hypothetical protein